MKKILMSLIVLAILAMPLTLARPHNANASNVAGASGSAVSKDAKNYQNLKGNYKATSSGSANVAGSVNSGASANVNNLKSNYGGSNNAAGVSGSANVNRR